MRRAIRTGLLLLLAFAADARAKDVARFAEVTLPASAPLVAPLRVAIGCEGRVFVALPVAGGIDVTVARDITTARRAAFSDAVHAVRRADLMTGGRRGPRIAAGPSGQTVVLAAITQRTKSGGGDLLAWRSADAGATWGEPVRVNDVPGSAAEGLFDLAALSDGRHVVVWLDVRTKDVPLRADFSADGVSWGEDAVAYAPPVGSICECCHPAIAATRKGGAVVAFRNSLAGDRDVWTALLAPGATKFEAATKSGTGSWRIAACPMAGPTVATRGDEVVAAWRREREVFLVAGAAKEHRVGEGTEPQLVLAESGLHVLWTSHDGALLHLMPGVAASVVVAQNAAFPCAAWVERGQTAFTNLVAWLDTATQRARLAEVR